MKPFVFSLFEGESIAGAFVRALDAEPGRYSSRRFPDGEFYIRVESSVADRSVILVTSLNQPDEKLATLYFFAATLRDLGAKKIILAAPYLGYLRQDRRFQVGEGITSRYFAKLLSGFLDGMVTVDPHLHRYASLNEIYSIPSAVVPAAPKISDWVRQNVERPFLIGPDRESEQWVQEVANGAGAPFLVLEKIRQGDRKVAIHFPPWEPWRDFTPVILDDIIASGRTMTETVRHLKKEGAQAPICLGVHGIFAENAYQDLLAAGAGEVVTCNTIPHPSNSIDVAELMVGPLKEMLSH